MKTKLFLKIGNSRVLICDKTKLLAEFETQKFKSKKHLKKFEPIEKIAFVSVVPQISKRLLARASQKKITIREFGLKHVHFKPAYRDGIGSDRLANIQAAIDSSKKSFVLIDIGTAITVEFFDRKKMRHLGGWIAAGPALLSKAFHVGTAQLPEIHLRSRDFHLPLGRNTRECLASGEVQMIRGVIEQARRLGLTLFGNKYDLILTGGWSSVFKVSKAKTDPLLFLKALTRL